MFPASGTTSPGYVSHLGDYLGWGCFPFLGLPVLGRFLLSGTSSAGMHLILELPLLGSLPFMDSPLLGRFLSLGLSQQDAPPISGTSPATSRFTFLELPRLGDIPYFWDYLS
ncbi:hypothetical protein TNCV_917621 [Trichonephila clavipes]|nr:hypothetical protein TNCV_917621 [Trichonephila clavipes]